VCTGGYCGGPVGCLPDGATCSTGSQCCVNYCAGGVCGGPVLDASPPPPPPVCPVVWNGNACDYCLTASCCKDSYECELDPACLQMHACFDGCYAGPGTGVGCAQKCNANYPSTAGNNLFQCGVSSCVAQCQ
jgi:hypothetical protein